MLTTMNYTTECFAEIEFDAQYAEQRLISEKRRKLQAIKNSGEALKKRDSGDSQLPDSYTFIEKLTTQIIKNVQVSCPAKTHLQTLWINYIFVNEIAFRMHRCTVYSGIIFVSILPYSLCHSYILYTRLFACNILWIIR